MSRVTNLILTFSLLENELECINKVNQFQYQKLRMNLVSVDFNKNVKRKEAWYGGTKFIEARIYIGAFNYLDLDEFMAHLKKIDWQKPEHVQVIVKEPGQEKFRMVEL